MPKPVKGIIKFVRSLLHENYCLRYSGSDIFIVVRDALMEPVRKLQTASHFKKVISPEQKVLLTPCSPGDPEAIEMNWTQLEAEQLLEPELTLQDFLRALQKAKSSVSEADIREHKKFTDEFGQDG